MGNSNQRCADADILRPGPQDLVDKSPRPRPHMSVNGVGERMLNIQIQISGAGPHGEWKTSRFQLHNQCATLHVAINGLSIILVLPNTIIV